MPMEFRVILLKFYMKIRKIFLQVPKAGNRDAAGVQSWDFCDYNVCPSIPFRLARLRKMARVLLYCFLCLHPSWRHANTPQEKL